MVDEHRYLLRSLLLPARSHFSSDIHNKFLTTLTVPSSVRMFV